MRCRRRATLSARWLASAALALTLPAAAPAAESRDELELWVPSFSFTLGFLTQQAEGSIENGVVLGPPLTTTDARGTGCLIDDTTRNGGLCPGSDPRLSDDSSSSDTSVAPLVEGAFELMTPRTFDAAWAPRLFAHADLAWVFAFERNLAGERKPARLRSPDLPPTQQDDIPEIAVSGQGTRAKSEVEPLVLSAGAGLAFTAVLFDRTVRIKPSFEYLRQDVEITGELKRAVKLESPARSFGTLDEFRRISLRQSSVETQHGLGAGLELEADASRLGPFALSVFAHARAYHLLGDLDYTLRHTNEFGETVTWRFDFDPWAWRGGAGIRFRWIPE